MFTHGRKYLQVQNNLKVIILPLIRVISGEQRSYNKKVAGVTNNFFGVAVDLLISKKHHEK
jgi:hypothetical protein